MTIIYFATYIIVQIIVCNTNTIMIRFNGKKIVSLNTSASLGTCLKSTAEMWLTTHSMKGLHKARQMRIMWCWGELLAALTTTSLNIV